MKRVYGLIGYPVKHSLSAKMHNAAFRCLGIEAEYRLFEVSPGSTLRDFFEKRVPEEGICGFNVTIPHKVVSLGYVDELRPPAAAIGALNTVSVSGGKLTGWNTDIAGFVNSLRDDLLFSPRGKNAFVFGAGGASRAVCYGLKSLGMHRIVVMDMDIEKALRLVNELKEPGFDILTFEYDKRVIQSLVLNSDLLVNATPCGMKSSDPELISGDYLHERLSVYDLIYNPSRTLLIKNARHKGLKAENGMGMLVRQGAAAFEIWTGQKAPIEAMKGALI